LLRMWVPQENGAIHKLLWQVTGQKRHLEQSYQYYRRGHDGNRREKLGYTSINAAFVLDLLASIDDREAASADAPAAAEHRGEASEIRKTLVDELAPLLDGTEGEAYFGLRDYENANTWLQRAKKLNPVDWEFRSTAFQLASLYQLQHPFTAGAA